MDFENIFKKVKIAVRHHNTNKESYSFRDEDDETWEFDMENRDDRTYEWRAEVEFADDVRRKNYGRKIYVPGPAKNEWGTEEETEFMLAEHLSSDAELAQKLDLLLIEFSKKDIDWSKADELEVEIYVAYGRRTIRIQSMVNGKKERNVIEGNGDDDSNALYLSEKLKDELGNPIEVYRWRAVFRIDGEDPLYHPGPSKRDFAESNESIIFLADYLPQDFGGTLVNV